VTQNNRWGEMLWRLVGSKMETSVALAKIQAAIVYVNLVKGTRRFAMLLCVLVFSVVILACGLLLIPVALCLFMPWTPETKTIVAASFGAAYVIIPLIVVMSLFSQKRWMKASQAGKLVQDVLKQ
jgi:hypothetical protein